MTLATIFFAILIFTASPFAFSATSDVRFDGRNPQTNAPCILYVINSGYLNDSQERQDFFMEVEAKGFSHNGDSPGPVVLRPVQNRPNVLFSKTESEDMVLFFSNNDFLQGSPIGFNLRWLHGNHYHYESCQNLKRR